MDTSISQARNLSPLKKLAVVALCGGAGFAVTAALILGGARWYASRPRPWNAAVIAARRPPGFTVSKDGKMIEFFYELENTGMRDYRIDSANGIQIYARNEDGILSHVLPDTSRLLDLPVFIPPGQRTAILFSMDFADIPTRNSNEPDAAFHERVRKYLEQRYGGLSGFVVFDNTYRNEVDLPKWSAEAPSSK